MQTAEEVIRGVLRPQRWAKIQAALEQRLGAVRVVVENLHNPHNTSAVLRTCEALGVQHIHAVETTGPFTLSRRITIGAHKWVTLHHHDTIAECARKIKETGFRLYGAVLDPKSLPLEEIPVDQPVALIFGNEKVGVSPQARDLCDGTYTIPMVGFVQSFNISVAAAISLYSLTGRVRRLRADGGLLSPEEKAEILESWLPKSVRWGRKALRALRPQPSR
jgi:tRNA (guanosine-2'-O-)-methyltransferase